MALLVTNSYMLYREICDVKLLQAQENVNVCAALVEYFGSGWNVCNLAGIAAHFTDACFLLEQVGAVGVLLNAFRHTSPLVQRWSRTPSSWAVAELRRVFLSNRPIHLLDLSV